ncbi:MAG: biotin carboxylase N-terminal domain-containing protein, partial [Candidatus Rokubacteria bacterium]|nr:biotin carboxylase N-terminal domain-containing protein [Candidatus Rokubacteria bacterium]
MPRLSRLLIANRGEIARRIIRSARQMGLATVTVYADPDAHAPFVTEADEAIALGGTAAAETYLDADKLIAAAQRAGADCVHPGYGFLSENGAFAEAVITAGLVWVGPRPETIRAMGDKLAAKTLMAKAGVPTLPAVAVESPAQAAQAAAAGLEYPLLVKAAAGGGGRGMRVVRRAEDLIAAVESARREAQGAFGDERVFLEPFLEGIRHVEVQILGDSHGQVIHCFERECSIQRRHQKIVEEAPSPALTPALREQICEAAVAAGRAMGYESAGTVEFILDARGRFFFLEVNTRLQVEHPVTEAITGLDLVREQLRIAQGERLERKQEEIGVQGHAIEVRLYAEDPAHDFLPAAGRLLAWEEPAGLGARFDSGVVAGSEVSVHFDPMLAKVIVHAATRTEAALRLATVLERLRLHGVTTNRDFLVGVLRHEAFLAGHTTTDFIERHRPPLRREPGEAELRWADCVHEVRETVFARLAAAWSAHAAHAVRACLEAAGDVDDDPAASVADLLGQCDTLNRTRALLCGVLDESIAPFTGTAEKVVRRQMYAMAEDVARQVEAGQIGDDADVEDVAWRMLQTH